MNILFSLFKKTAEQPDNGTLKVIDGNIIVRDPGKDGSPAVIKRGKNMRLMVDGTEIDRECQVWEHSRIEIVLEKQNAGRNFNIHVSEDKMEAYVEISYTPEISYKLKDSPYVHKLQLDVDIHEKTDPPRYTEEEIRNELIKNKISHGLIEENLKKVVESNNIRMIVARGKLPVDGKDDFIEVKFKTSSDIEEDRLGNVDFKSIGYVNSVKAGDIIAVRHEGKTGESGCDISGKKLNFKEGKKIKLNAGSGAVMRDENTAAAAIYGKPYFIQNTFYVKKVHELSNDVDLSTGNICFSGDVIVHGNVREGMSINCGNNLIVYKNADRASLTASGSIVIKGNVVNSRVYAGGVAAKNIKYISYLRDFVKNLNELVNEVQEIKNYGLLGQDKKDGEIVKILLENRFKNIVSNISGKYCEYGEDELIKLIKSKLVGMAPLGIADYCELYDLVYCAGLKIKQLDAASRMPVRLELSYCQDSYINSSGDVIVTGRGEYISDITANKSIEFLQKNAVARGGKLSAGDSIKCSVVGSSAGAATMMEVGKDGNIFSNFVYHNTVLKIGDRKLVLDSSCENLHAYLKDEDIIVDKFKS